MARYKTFDSTGIAPNGRLFAGDLNAIQDMKADLLGFAQTIELGTLKIGEAGLQLNRYGAGEAQITGALRSQGAMRALGGLYGGEFTTAQRDAIAVGSRPKGLHLFNTTTGRLEVNIGTDASPAWVSAGYNILGTEISADTIVAANIAPNAVANSELATDSVDSRVIQPGVVGNTELSVSDTIQTNKYADRSVTGGKIALATIGDGEIAVANKDGAVGTPSLRTLGSGALQAAPGNDARLSDQRTPLDGSVTAAKIVNGIIDLEKLTNRTKVQQVSMPNNSLTDTLTFFPDGSTTTLHFYAPVPLDWQGGDITFKIILSAVGGGTAVDLDKSANRVRAGEGGPTTIVGVVTGDDHTGTVLTAKTIACPAASIALGDGLEAIWVRNGAAGGDNYVGSVIVYAAWIEYLGKGG